MELLLVRHAIAEDPTADRPDALRALTARGRRRFREAVGGLAGLGLQVDLVLHSPWLRARQTAELMAPLLSADGSLRRCDALARPPDEALLAELTAEIQAAIAEAERHPNAPREEVFDDVYAELPWHLREQREAMRRAPAAKGH